MANYTIDININDIQGSQDKVIAGQEVKKEQKDDINKTAKGLGTFVATQAVKPFIRSAMSFASSSVQLSTGSSILQEQVNFAMQSVNDVRSIISTTSAGFALSGGNPIGAVIGFAVGVAQKGIDILFKQAEIDLNKAVEDRQIAYMQNRLGPAFNSSRRN